MWVVVLLIICLFIGYNIDFFFSKLVEKNIVEDMVIKFNFFDNKKIMNENLK